MGEVQDVRDLHKTFVAPAIKSFEHYDFSRAKICCSLTWLVAKAYGTGRCIYCNVTSNQLPARCVDAVIASAVLFYKACLSLALN